MGGEEGEEYKGVAKFAGVPVTAGYPDGLAHHDRLRADHPELPTT
jgi:hypothetical protein